MKSSEVRKKFIEFFKSKNHVFQPSSPIVLKNDPTLLFVNAGMNQFKDFFLGNQIIKESKVVNSQKCLRVSGKHNDLEEVGHDTYHHTMFEMLGNWSFGDYFKYEAIRLAWSFLTQELAIPPDQLYVTYFKGDEKQNLDSDTETKKNWKSILNEDRIIAGNKEDNFWEMGQVGPCGPSTEIHIDLRHESEKKGINARDLVNQDHPKVIEIWNIVFIEFNRKKNGQLELLPKKHVDTGMGFERLCMVMQNKQSTYDTDLFQDLINYVANTASVKYGERTNTDIAIRVIVDHIRAIVFSIADGQLPGNTGAGYVIRRILRRAVRYGYNYLGFKTPFLHNLVDFLAKQFNNFFPEISNQKTLIKTIIKQEEKLFLNTLGKGLELIKVSINKLNDNNIMSGKDAFVLYDTYGFPPDLTALILKEKGLSFNQSEFDTEMQKQKSRSRSASEINFGDWVDVHSVPIVGFVGYECQLHIAKIVKYRKVIFNDQEKYHIVFDKTPFYPEGGGQVGDSGVIKSCETDIEKQEIIVTDTKKENNIIIHIVDSIPNNLKENEYTLIPDYEKRSLISRNHSSTHLLHHELRQLLGDHVEQKGSYIDSDYLRFDFSHFDKLSADQIFQIEEKVNKLVISGLDLNEFRRLEIQKAKDMGAIALFGEKYGNNVRVIKFGNSIELCGGTHVNNTAEIGLFKITNESSVAAGVRRIEAVTSNGAINFINSQLNTLSEIKMLFNNSDNLINSLKKIIHENKELNNLSEKVKKSNLAELTQSMFDEIVDFYGYKLLVSELEVEPGVMKNICFQLIEKFDNIFAAIITKWNNKIIINIAISKKLVASKKINASNIINDIGHHINAKGGGQPFFAVASGNKESGINKMIVALKELLKSF